MKRIKPQGTERTEVEYETSRHDVELKNIYINDKEAPLWLYEHLEREFWPEWHSEVIAHEADQAAQQRWEHAEAMREFERSAS